MSLKDQVSDGLPSDFEATITAASFLRDLKVGNGQVLLCSLTLTRNDGEADVEARYAVGSGWNDVGGDRIVNEQGATKISKQTQYGEFASRVGALVPDDVAESIDVMEAKSWVGLSFYWERITQHKEGFTGRDGVKVEARDVTRLWPTSYLASAATAAEAAPAEETTTLTGGGKVVSLPASLATQVRALASTMEYGQWTSAVLALPNALDHDDLVSAVSSQEFYASLRS